jgi:hypothetical protein
LADTQEPTGLASFGESRSRDASGCSLDPSRRESHWVRLARGRPEAVRRYRLPLGSFGAGASEAVRRYRLPLGSSENRGRHDCNHASSAPPGPRPFSWGGVTIPMVMTVRLARGASRGPIVTACHWVRLARRRRGGQSLQLAIGFVWRRGDSRVPRVVRDPCAGASAGPHGFGRPNPWHPRSRVAHYPNLPLGSFGAGASRAARRYRLPMGSFGLAGLASFGRRSC